MMELMTASERLLVALDTSDIAHARQLSQSLMGVVGGIKLGLEFFNCHGPAGIQTVTNIDRNSETSEAPFVKQPFFLDLKYHDIPNTVSGAIREAMKLQPMILNVHAAGGFSMMQRARDTVIRVAEQISIKRPLLIAVTVLTSLDSSDLEAVGQDSSTRDQVVRLAQLSQKAGLDGVVCSPQEITPVREACGPDFKLITPGVRPVWAHKDDQKRFMTPAEAISLGADWLVIGRPVTQAPDPVAAVRAIADEINAVL